MVCGDVEVGRNVMKVVVVDDAVFMVRRDKQERKYHMTVCMFDVTVGCCIGLIGMGIL